MPKPRLHSVVEMDGWRPDGHVFLPVTLCFGFLFFVFLESAYLVRCNVLLLTSE